MAQTVQAVLDKLADGRMSLDEVVADFAAREWPALARRATVDEAWAGADPEPPDPNSWDAVNADPRLTADSYQQLAAAYTQARERR